MVFASGLIDDFELRLRHGGKASLVQFLHFPFTDAQIAAFRQQGAEVTLVTVYNALHRFPDAGLLREVMVEPGRS